MQITTQQPLATPSDGDLQVQVLLLMALVFDGGVAGGGIDLFAEQHDAGAGAAAFAGAQQLFDSIAGAGAQQPLGLVADGGGVGGAQHELFCVAAPQPVRCVFWLAALVLPPPPPQQPPLPLPTAAKFCSNKATSSIF